LWFFSCPDSEISYVFNPLTQLLATQHPHFHAGIALDLGQLNPTPPSPVAALNDRAHRSIPFQKPSVREQGSKFKWRRKPDSLCNVTICEIGVGRRVGTEFNAVGFPRSRCTRTHIAHELPPQHVIVPTRKHPSISPIKKKHYWGTTAPRFARLCRVSGSEL